MYNLYNDIAKVRRTSGYNHWTFANKFFSPQSDATDRIDTLFNILRSSFIEAGKAGRRSIGQGEPVEWTTRTMNVHMDPEAYEEFKRLCKEHDIFREEMYKLA